MSAGLLSALVLATASGPAPVLAVPPSSRFVEQEVRLLFASEEVDRLLRRAPPELLDAAASAYVQSVLDRLHPDAGMRVHVLRRPGAEAFVLPNGTIYMTDAFLLRVDTESQLAVVLAHEGAHYLRRHGVQSVLGAKSAGATGIIAALVTGAPVFGAIVSGTSYTSFSQSLEREADELALTEVARAGYTTRDAVMPLNRIALEAARVRGHGAVSATDRRLLERLEVMRELVGDGLTGETYADRYRTALNPSRMNAVRALLDHRRLDELIYALSDQRIMESLPREAEAYLGEALRLRNARGDAARARTVLEDAVVATPDHAAAWRAYGLWLTQHGDGGAASEALERYIALAPDAPDAAIIARRQPSESGPHEASRGMTTIQSRAFAIDVPDGWTVQRRGARDDLLRFVREGVAVQEWWGEWTSWNRRGHRTWMLPVDLAAQFVSLRADARDAEVVDIVSIEAATLAGRDGYRVEYRLLSGFAAPIRGVAYGGSWQSPGVYTLAFEALETHYFERDLATFEAGAASLRRH